MECVLEQNEWALPEIANKLVVSLNSVLCCGCEAVDYDSFQLSAFAVFHGELLASVVLRDT